MAIDTITPAANNVLQPGDSISFLIDDTYTTITIEVETLTGWEYVYDSSLGGAQSGYTVVVTVPSAGRQKFEFSRTSGWNLNPFSVRVTENETGSSAVTTTNYYLGSQVEFPQGSDPYYGTYQGNFTVTDAGTLVRNDVKWINIAGTGYTITDDGGGKVTITLSGGGGGSSAWGGITGTLSAQTDLQAALDAKVTGPVAWGGITGTLSAQTDLQAALDAKVTGPASATDSAVVLYNATGGKLIKDSLTLGYASGQLDISSATSSLRMSERAAGPTPGAGKGSFWVKNDTPSRPQFTDDAGTTFPLLSKETWHQIGLVAVNSTSWIGPDNYAYWDDSQNGTYGTVGANPTMDATNMSRVVSAPGTITTCRINWRTNGATAEGTLKLWKFTPTNDSSATRTGVDLGTLMTIPGTQNTANRYVTSVTLSGAVSAGDYVVALYKATVTNSASLYYSLAFTLEHS